MENNVMNYDDDMVEISISDLILTVLKRWPVILACAVACALLFGAAKGLRDASAKPGAKETTAAAKEAGAEEYDPEAAQKEYERAMERYRLELEDYDRRMETYLFALDMKDDYLLAYNESRRLLIEELDHIKEIPPEDDAAMFASLNKINDLKAAMNTADGTLRKYVSDFRMPELPVEPEPPVPSEELEGAGTEGAEGAGVQAGVFRFSKKFAVLGFVFGAFAAAFLFALIYVFDGTVKTAASLNRLFGVQLLGAPDKTALVTANIRNFLPSDVKKILITGSRSSDCIALITDAARTRMEGIEFVMADRLNDNADAAARLAEVDAVILVEQLRASKLKDITEEVMMVRSAGRKLIGVAV